MLGSNRLVSGSWGWAGAARVAGGHRVGCREGSLGKWLCSIGHSSFYVLTTGTVLPLHAGWISSLGRARAQVGYGLRAGWTEDILKGFVGRTMLHFWLFAASGPLSLSGLQILRSESLRGSAQTMLLSLECPRVCEGSGSLPGCSQEKDPLGRATQAACRASPMHRGTLQPALPARLSLPCPPPPASPGHWSCSSPYHPGPARAWHVMVVGLGWPQNKLRI